MRNHTNLLALGLSSVVGLLAAALPLTAQAAPASKIKVMLLTGQCSKYHNWAVSSVVLKRELEEAGCFAVTSVLTPPPGSDMSGFHPNFKDYAVVVMDYEGDEWPEATKQAFAEFISQGGGLVSFHATDNTFPKWAAWNEMIGVGGWEGRNESCGPKVRWRDGKMVLDSTPGNATHPPKHDYVIEVRTPQHPVMQGLPAKFMHAEDELYSQLRGPAKNLTVLATAVPDKKKFGDKATGENEPVLMAITFGKGRIFHTTLGHVGPKDVEPVKALNCVGFSTTLQRGTEWAASGKVTLPVPKDFPTAEKTSVR